MADKTDENDIENVDTGEESGGATPNPITTDENGLVTIHGNVYVDGNLESAVQVTGQSLELRETNKDGGLDVVLTTAGDSIQVYKNTTFKGAVSFNDGQIKVGYDNTLKNAAISSPILTASDKLVVGQDNFIVDNATRWIAAEPMSMKLARLNVNKLFPVEVEVSSKFVANDKFEVKKQANINYMVAEKAQVTTTLTTNGLSALSAEINGTGKISYLTVEKQAVIDNDLTINGALLKNGVALTVKKGKVAFDDGMEVNGLSRFKTLQIHGGSTGSIGFLIDRNIKSLIEGDVTIHGSKLFLDETKLITSNFLLTSDQELMDENPTSGIDFTSDTDWELYEESMVNELPIDTNENPEYQETYKEENFDPVAMVNAAISRNEVNYESIQQTVKSLINPITYLMEQTNPDAPKRFSINQGKYRIDHSGNILMKNIVAERAKFSSLDAYKFNANHFHVDKLVTTGIKTHVVSTDNLLKSDGITEFTGVVNSNADVFIGEESKVRVANGAEVTFQNGASLVLKNGANLDLGNNTTMKMNGDVELDFNRLTFVDSTTGRKYKIGFRDAHESEGSGVVMTYKQVYNEEPEPQASSSSGLASDTSVFVERTINNARKLNDKLKKFGL